MRRVGAGDRGLIGPLTTLRTRGTEPAEPVKTRVPVVGVGVVDPEEELSAVTAGVEKPELAGEPPR
jgi:hypothetical protein